MYSFIVCYIWCLEKCFFFLYSPILSIFVLKVALVYCTKCVMWQSPPFKRWTQRVKLSHNSRNYFLWMLECSWDIPVGHYRINLCTFLVIYFVFQNITFMGEICFNCAEKLFLVKHCFESSFIQVHIILETVNGLLNWTFWCVLALKAIIVTHPESSLLCECSVSSCTEAFVCQLTSPQNLYKT